MHGDPGPTCWICGSTDYRKFRASTIQEEVDATSVRISDSAYGQTAALSKCLKCDFVFANPPPHPAVVDLYRDMDDDAYHASSSARCAQMRLLLDQVAAHHPRAQTLLDIGAGTGLLVSEARGRGLRADGIEPSRWCVETAAKMNDVTLYCGTLQEHANELGEYDLVMLIDVVEHTTDPLTMIIEAVAHLAPGGVIAIVTPDIGSFTARMMGRWWWHHRIGHVCFFNRRSMRRALSQAGVRPLADNFSGWRLPASYLCERLRAYLPLPPVSNLLRRLALSERLAEWTISINLRDSRAFIGQKD